MLTMVLIQQEQGRRAHDCLPSVWHDKGFLVGGNHTCGATVFLS
jgi:hypothetical protein